MAVPASIHARIRLASISLVSIVALAVPAVALADDFRVQVGNFFGNVILMVLQAVAQLVAMVTHFLIIIAQYSDFVKNDVVSTGWNIVTAVANMFFIIALLIIALGTVLRIQNYRYNRLLGNVIVMAFLVNFSKTIAAFFIQTSQIVMLTFVNAFKEAAFGNFATMFGLDKVLNFSQTADPKTLGDVIGALLIGLFFLTVALVTIIALSIVLAVRIVYLWILVILSPFAYALRILPNTEKWASQWWGEFGKWVTTGPVIAFFLWLALAILSQSGTGDSATTQGAGSFITSQKSISGAIAAIPPAEADLYFGGTKLLDLDNFISFIIAIVFLWMGLDMATKTGGLAGKWAGKVAGAGLAAYGTVSMLNAVRDRTVAPIQGYLQSRDQRRKQGVSERAALVGAAVDTATSNTIGLAGRGRVAMTAGAGALLRGEGVDKAIGAAAAGAKRGTREMQQAQQRVEKYKAERISTRGGEMDMSNPNVTVNDLKAMARGGDDALAARAVATLIERGERLESKDDVNMVKKTAGYLGTRQLGTGLQKSIGQLDPELARKVYFGDSGTEDTNRKLQEAIQARVVGTNILSQADLAFIDSTAGKKEEWGTFTKNIARNAAEMKKLIEGYDINFRNQIMKATDMTGETDQFRRMFSEVSGQTKTAFTNGQGAARTFDKVAYQKYFVDRGKKFSDITASNDLDKEAIEALQEKDITEKELMDIQAKSSFHRDNLIKATKDHYSDLTALGAAATFDRTHADYKNQETLRRVMFRASGGTEDEYMHGDVNSDDSFGRLAKSFKAYDVRKLHVPGSKYKNPAIKPIMDRLLGQFMNLKEISEYANMGPDQFQVARDSLDSAVVIGNAAPAGSSARTRRNRIVGSESTQGIFTP